MLNYLKNTEEDYVSKVKKRGDSQEAVTFKWLVKNQKTGRFMGEMFPYDASKKNVFKENRA